MNHDRFDRLAAEIAGLEGHARAQAIAALLAQARTEHSSELFTLTALTVRNHHDRALAFEMFSLGLDLPEPWGRRTALFEGAIAAGQVGEPRRAAEMLAELEVERTLGGYDQLVFAHQLGRLGDMARATERLERAMALEPRFAAEVADFRQFFDYLRQFPLEHAQARADALRAVFPARSPAEVAAEVQAALREGRPYSMIRLNDGDGAYLHLGVDDEAAYSALYARNRREFLRIYFGDDARLLDPDWLSVTAELDTAIAGADCLGADIANSLAGEYRWASLRNVPSLFNIVRKLEQVAAQRPDLAGRVGLADNWINQFLLYDGHLERLLSAQIRLGLVSCHAALPGALQSRFGLEQVFFHRTPGEAAITGGVEPEPLGVWHGRMKAELEREARPGVLYLVAAGLQAKIYCDIIKRAGGVALDVGSVADIWMQAPTRDFVFGSEAFALS
jgi:hypothetical protein